jgi:hypothetical protein
LGELLERLIRSLTSYKESRESTLFVAVSRSLRSVDDPFDAHDCLVATWREHSLHVRDIEASIFASTLESA